MLDKNQNKEMIEAVAALAKEKGISKEVLFTAIEEALRSAYKNNFNKQNGAAPVNTNVRVELNRENGAVHLYARKTVVLEVEDDATEISLEEARKIQPSYEEDDIVETEVTPSNFRRMAAQTAKQVIVQKIREAERGKTYDSFIEKENEILTAIIYSVDPISHDVNVEIGKTAGILEVSQQMPTDNYTPGERLKVYVLEVDGGRGGKGGTQVHVSRIHPGLVKRLFEMEVPEIQKGEVQIKSIAREAGSRTKIAVHSTDAMIDPVGSCVGPRGQRVDRVVTELKNEKIDIIKWSQDPTEFVSNALNPANVLSATINEKEKICNVVVPDNQLSLAIGKEGQNARLAARLTGWKIDIKSATQAAEAEQEKEAPSAAEAKEPEMPDTSDTLDDLSIDELDLDDLKVDDLDIPDDVK
ncbi:MAG: transcription termination/antitermination protein NusA [Clostridia bacterium]|nr:transcription termination/antitermination protein NusA [Clostridia bacterium]